MSEPENILSYEAVGPTGLQDGERVIWEHEEKRPLEYRAVCRLTNRRIMRILTQTGSKERTNLAEVSQFDKKRNRRTGQVSLRVHGVLFYRVPLNTPIESTLLRLCPRLGRRRRQEMRSRIMPRVSVPDASDWSLMNDERLLWTGASHAWDALDFQWVMSRAKSLVFGLIPASAIWMNYFGIAGRRYDIHPVFLVIAFVWLAILLYRQTIGLLLTSLRRSSTRYAITDKRVIARTVSMNRVNVSSMFLYRIDGARLKEPAHPKTGRGTIYMFAATLENVDDAQRVCAILLEAIYAAGGPIAPSAEASEVD